MIHVCPVFHALMIRTCYSNKLPCGRFKFPSILQMYTRKRQSVFRAHYYHYYLSFPLSLSLNGIKPLPLVTSNCNALY